MDPTHDRLLNRLLRRVALLSGVGVLVGCSALMPPAPSQDMPEAATGTTARTQLTFQRQAVATANPLATAAGYRMLLAGGSAVDAAIAAQMVLTLVEPQSSGIGGGAFLMLADGKTIRAYDGRETAPAATTPQLFMKNGKPMGFFEAVVGGRSVGTPGVLRMLELAHRQHGRLPWAVLFEPAIALATTGFAISPRLYELLVAEAAQMQDPGLRSYFFTADGRPLPVGWLLKNPELARVFKDIATRGSIAFYQGELARVMVAAVRGHATNPGLLDLNDLASYRPVERAPLCFDHTVYLVPLRSYVICGFPPPGSGAITIAQIMGMLNQLPAIPGPGSTEGPTTSSTPGLAPGRTEGLTPSLTRSLTPAWLHRYTEASRLAFADRAVYLADPDFVQPPGRDWRSLIETDYLRSRAALIGAARLPNAAAGRPGEAARAYAPMAEQAEAGTSHISIVDAHGQTLALTTTIEYAFGARILVSTGLPGGFLLNNQLTDFSFVPSDQQGRLVANRVEPGKRPRSSMSPTLIFERGKGGILGRVVATLGSPGGPAIIHYTAKVIFGLLHWELQAQPAIDLPNFSITSPNGPLQLENRAYDASFIDAISKYGQPIRYSDLPSGLNVLERMKGGWHGGADPRREGAVLGD